jgi:hypothetical protein
MALVSSDDLACELLAPTHECFYCGNVLKGEAFIYWMGIDERGQQIWMHPDCAKRLSDHLNKDYHNHVTANTYGT